MARRYTHCFNCGEEVIQHPDEAATKPVVCGDCFRKGVNPPVSTDADGARNCAIASRAPAVLLVAAGPDRKPRRILRHVSRGGAILGAF